MTYATRKALFWTTVAIVGGSLGWAFTAIEWRASLPLGIFFALLVANTFPSVRTFSSIVPQDDGRHALADLALALVYVFLAASFGNPQQFVLCALILFLVAAGKYSLMVEEIPHPDLIQRKVRADLIGALGCAMVLAVMIHGQVLFAAWAMAITFALANIYVLVINPLYRV